MIKRHFKSYKHAYDGLCHAVATQPNFLIHGLISATVIAAGVYFGFSLIEWAIVSLVIGLGLAIELINTSIEAVVDLVTDEWKKPAKIAKDTAAAAMLVYAGFSALFATLLFASKL